MPGACARTRARDDLAEMFCKRIASITKRAWTELEEIRARQLQLSERLIGHYRDFLVHLDPRNAAGTQAVLALARAAVERAGGFEAELADNDAVAAHHANHDMPLADRRFRRDRSTMFAFVRTLELEATSADRSMLDALDHAVVHSHLTREAVKAELAKHAFLRGLDAHELDLSGLPAERRRYLATIGQRSTAQALSRREPERPYRSC